MDSFSYLFHKKISLEKKDKQCENAKCNRVHINFFPVGTQLKTQCEMTPITTIKLFVNRFWYLLY